MLWPLTAIFGLTWILGQFENLMLVLHWVAVVLFIFMGVMLIRHADNSIMTTEGRLTRPGMWHAFSAGVAAVIGNPKAIFFYMAVLPGFFDLTHVTAPDILLIVALSMIIPLAGNLVHGLRGGAGAQASVVACGASACQHRRRGSADLRWAADHPAMTAKSWGWRVTFPT